jgi:hypothetical protein
MQHATPIAPLPPWGQLDQELIDQVRAFEIPADWQPLDGSPRDPPGWQRWLNKALVAPLDQLLWPEYQPGSSRWGTPEIRALNLADFLLMDNLRHRLRAPIDAMSPTTLTHSHLFEEEDGDIGLGAAYDRYDPTLPAADREKMRDLMYDGIGDKAGTVSTQLKQRFQRPRAYQVALLYGNTVQFTHRVALSAATPSLVSGHCLQGAMAICNVYAVFRQTLSTKSVGVLMHYAVDIGDRRVFAGVHYPSDNLSSWFTALTLIPHVFTPTDAPAVGKFLWEAIRTRSHVYREVARYAATNSPYGPVLGALELLGKSF